MGCDIHLYVEVRENNQWKACGPWKVDERDRRDDEQECEQVADIPYDRKLFTGRCYPLFAILADVRNGRGFAGCDTGDPFVPIDSPKGLPLFVTEKVKAVSDRWDCDGHSHSWFSVAELLAFDWTQLATRRGWVNGGQFEEWERLKQWNPSPPGWCGGVSGGGIEKVSVEEMRKRVLELKTSPDFVEQAKKQLVSVYCLVEWTQEYASCCRVWWYEAMPKLLALGEPGNVRIVFWFDN